MPKFHVKCILLLLFIFSGYLVRSQSSNLVLKVADDLFENKDYYGAIHFYEKALEIDSNNAEVLYKYARNLSLTNQHEKSSRYYQKALILGGLTDFPLVAYYLAESYRSSGDYRKAKRYYNQALRPFRSDRKSYWYQRIDQNKDAASWASRNSALKIYNPVNLTQKVNTSFSEYAPTIHNKSLYYSGMIADSATENDIIKDKQFYSRIYCKSLTTNEEAKELLLSKELSEKFQQLHLANPAFYGSDMYFSVCDSNFNCKIWKGQLVENVINNAFELNKNINHPTSNNTQAYPVEIDNELYLFFSSDRDGGEGQLDLYVAREASFGFDQALNLGPSVNSLGNEITPFYDLSSQTLFFSSDWHLGYGGYDIFLSKGKPINFGQAENIGFGINTPSNEYYFKAQSPIALLASNRKEGNVDGKSDCCNDLYELNYKLDSISSDDQFTEQAVSIDILNGFLPMELFFHNDEPNPNSRKKETDKNYIDLALSYQDLKDEYLSTYAESVSRKERDVAKNDLEQFFEDDLQNGILQLERFTPLLLKELQKGSKIELAVRGFASSLSEDSYNLNLTSRRIESLINYFEQAENGAFIPYLNGNSANGGKLTFNKIPYGEYAVAQIIDENDKIAAVYSPQAATERKIELLAVSNSNTSSSLSAKEAAKIEFNTNTYDLGKIEDTRVINRFFNVKNTGNDGLKLYNVSSNCECVSINYPSTIIAGEEAKILIDISTENLSGEINIELIVVSNTNPNLNRLNIKFELE